MSRGPSVNQSEPFSSTSVSPSRVGALTQCGVAFKLKYIDGVPEEVSGSAALFGSVVHKALEWWSPDRSQELLPLMRNAWLEETEGTSVRAFLEAYKPLSAEIVRAEYAAAELFKARTGRETKAVRMTGEWKKSAAAKKLDKFLRSWLPKLEAGSPWRFHERDPLPALYNESLVLAKRYEAKWKHLPPSLHTEFKFSEEWLGFTLNGYIDSIEPLMHRDSGEMIGVGVLDYKTYRKGPVAELESDQQGEGAEMKDHRQMVMYDVAIREMLKRGALTLPWSLDDVPLYVGIDYVRLGERRFWSIQDADRQRLYAELCGYQTIVDGGAFLPAEKNRNIDFCPYPSQCCLRNTAAAGGGATRVEVRL